VPDSERSEPLAQTGTRCGREERQDEAGTDLKETSHVVLAFSARPNVRGKGATTAWRQALATDNVHRTCGQGLVARRWRSP